MAPFTTHKNGRHALPPSRGNQESEHSQANRFSLRINDPLRVHAPTDRWRNEVAASLEIASSSVSSPLVELRREWQAYRVEFLPKLSNFSTVLKKYLIQKPQQLQVVNAFQKWKRKARIATKWQSYDALVTSQRIYYVRKLVLRAYWRHVSSCFLHWKTFATQSAEVLGRLLLRVYARQQMRLALCKWYRRVLMTERLEEALAASVWLRWQNRTTKVSEKKRRGVEARVLVASWVQWQTMVRTCRCRASSRRLRFQRRWIFTRWRRYVAQNKQIREMVHDLVCKLSESSVGRAQGDKEQKCEDTETQERAALAIDQVISAHQTRRRLQFSFQVWRMNTNTTNRKAGNVEHKTGTSAIKDPNSPSPHRPWRRRELNGTETVRLPEKTSSLYRVRRTSSMLGKAANAVTKRPQWR